MYAKEKENALSKDYHDCDLVNAYCNAWFLNLWGCCFTGHHVNIKLNGILIYDLSGSRYFIVDCRLFVCIPRVVWNH